MSRRKPRVVQLFEPAPSKELTPGFKVAVVVVTHEPYVDTFLPEAIASWDAQTVQPDWKVIVHDGCMSENTHWTRLKVDAGHPSPARNAALELLAAEVDWIRYADADNVVAPDTLEKELSEARRWATPNTAAILAGEAPYGRVDIRECFCADSGSLWRTAALVHVGGWRKCWLEDWELAKRLQQAGWRFFFSGEKRNLRKHPSQRSRTMKVKNKLWSARSIGIITLQAGDVKKWVRWSKAFRKMELPEQCGLTIVDDSGSYAFHTRIQSWALSQKLPRITVMRAPKAFPAHLNDGYNIHARVGHNYAAAFQATPEDLILTWESDVLPIEPDAIRRLAALHYPGHSVAAVAGAYPSRTAKGRVVVSTDPAIWKSPTWKDIGAKQEVGMVAGGFTLWSRCALEEHGFLGYSFDSKAPGWDSFISQRLRKGGWRLLLSGEVQCIHDGLWPDLIEAVPSLGSPGAITGGEEAVAPE